ncbi:MAG TPA: ATP-binding protein [Anaeromyxobacter sp.]
MHRGPDLTVGTWLAIGFGTAAVLLVGVGGISARMLDGVERAERLQAEVLEPRAAAAGALEEGLLRLGLAARTYALTHDARHRAAYEDAVRGVEEARARLDALPDGGPRSGRAEALELVAPYREAADAFVALVEATPRAGASPEVREAEVALTERREAALSRLAGYVERQEATSRAATGEILALQGRARLAIGGSAVAVLAVLAATALLVVRRVRGPALELVEATRRLAQGDHAAAAALATPGPGVGTRRNELRRLGAAFGRMALELEAREHRIADQQVELQAQHEELQAQHEELQTQNEELQSQQEELQAQNEELQSQQEELQSQADELRVQDERLLDADRRKDDFLAVLSHELRNPLAPIVSGLEILHRADPASDAARRARAVIDRQVKHLVRLVDDLLDVTRITRGKVSLRRTRVELGGLVRHVCEDNAATLTQREVSLDVAAPPEPLWVDADPARIAQIVGNLLQNAAKFTAAGGRVSVAVEAGEARARVRVRDTGVGIPAHVLPKLFQPFMQAESSLARTSGGLGLGLALVKGLAELHGGTARAESAGEGRGSEFTVELPLRFEASAAAGPAGSARAAARPRPGRRVLVIEDQADAAESLADVLRLAGHEVRVARDGAEGLRHAREGRLDAVLCDIGLPGMDGYEVARRLRADGHAATLLVALTGYALPDDLRRAREAGFDAHLTKPARPEEIEAVLARAGRIAGAT